MTSLPDLHDRFFDGLWLSPDKRARLFVRTVTGERSTIVLTEVEALNVSGLRVGNIIFDLALIAPEKLTVTDIEQLYDLKDDQGEMARRLLSKAQQQGLSALEINPSYGPRGRCSFELSNYRYHLGARFNVALVRMTKSGDCIQNPRQPGAF